MSVGENVEIRLSPSGPVVFTTGANGAPVPMVVGRGMVLRMVEAVSSSITQNFQAGPAPLADTGGNVFHVEMPECDPARLYVAQLQSNIFNNGNTAGDLVQVNVNIEASADAGANWYRISSNRFDSQENSARTIIAKFPLAVLPATFPLAAGQTIKLRAVIALYSGTSTQTSFETHGEPGGCVFTLMECQP